MTQALRLAGNSGWPAPSAHRYRMEREPLSATARGSGLESKGRNLCHQPTAIMGCRLTSCLRMVPQDAPKRRRECWGHPCELGALVRPAPRRSACGDIAAQDRSARSRAAGHSVEYSVDGSASWQSESQSSSSLSLRDGLDMSGVKEVLAVEAGLGNGDFKINTIGCLAVKTSTIKISPRTEPPQVPR
jgi:hypothetical protein